MKRHRVKTGVVDARKPGQRTSGVSSKELISPRSQGGSTLGVALGSVTQIILVPDSSLAPSTPDAVLSMPIALSPHHALPGQVSSTWTTEHASFAPRLANAATTPTICVLWIVNAPVEK
eukprot:scaffold5360_cov118-Isochrysis_galbana.AAC.9